MKLWQKIWLYFLIVYSSLHLMRDFLQDNGIKIFLSTILVKKPINLQASSILWASFNTYLIASVEILLAIICLKRKSFDQLGKLTLIIAIITLTAWLIYWFWL